MRKILIMIASVVLVLAWACTPENNDLDFTPVDDEATILLTDLKDDNSFMLVNGLRGKILTPKWDLGNGQTAIGDTVYAAYAFQGEYTVTMKGYDAGKYIEATRTIKITQDNMALVSDPVYQYLTGGVDAINGKTWVLDSLRTGHVRLWKRQIGQQSDDKKSPLFYSKSGMYDDEITFKLLGAECIYDNKGASFSHGGTIDGIANYRINQLKQMGTVTSFAPSPKGDFLVNYTPADQPQKWSITKRSKEVDGKLKDEYFLSLTGGAYFFFYRGNAPGDIVYKIDSIGENYMRVIHEETYPASRATAKWEEHYLLVPKGYPIQPEVPTVPEPPKEEHFNVTFEAGTETPVFTYFDSEQTGWMGLPSYSVVRNVSMTGINPSDSIARFVRGKGYEEQLKLKRNYTFDLTSKNKLKMNVYMPSTNNYQGVNLKPTVEVRLVDSKDASKISIKTITVSNSDFDKWVELTFDFSDISTITSFDTWVIQFGGKYAVSTSSSPGLFYFDNLKLTNN